jgi:hypothetical protein
MDSFVLLTNVSYGQECLLQGHQSAIRVDLASQVEWSWGPRTVAAGYERTVKSAIGSLESLLTLWGRGTTSKACWIWPLQYDGDQRGRKGNTFRRKYKAKTIDALVEDTSKMANQGAFIQGVCVSAYADWLDGVILINQPLYCFYLVSLLLTYTHRTTFRLFPISHKANAKYKNRNWTNQFPTHDF